MIDSQVYRIRIGLHCSHHIMIKGIPYLTLYELYYHITVIITYWRHRTKSGTKHPVMKLIQQTKQTIGYLCRMDFSTFTLLTGPFPIWGVFGYILLIPCFIEIPVFNANSVDRDQTPRSAASDLGLHCLSMSLLGDARLKWVNNYSIAHYNIRISRIN